MVKKRILILGANGMLGTILTSKLKKNSLFDVSTHSNSTPADYSSNLGELQSIKKLIMQDSKPDILINLLALTDVDKCEDDKPLAERLNVIPMKNLVKLLLGEKINLKLIHISTDHVYDMSNSSESDIKITNNYALTKYIADELSQLVDAAVLRTNFFGKSMSVKKSFSDWVIENVEKKQKINGFTDVFFSPLHINSLCIEIEHLINNFIPGVYNLGSKLGMSKYDFIIELCKHKGFATENIKAIKYVESNLKVPRPLDMRMNVSKYEQTFKRNLPTLLEEISKC